MLFPLTLWSIWCQIGCVLNKWLHSTDQILELLLNICVCFAHTIKTKVCMAHQIVLMCTLFCFWCAYWDNLVCHVHCRFYSHRWACAPLQHLSRDCAPPRTHASPFTIESHYTTETQLKLCGIGFQSLLNCSWLATKSGLRCKKTFSVEQGTDKPDWFFAGQVVGTSRSSDDSERYRC